MLYLFYGDSQYLIDQEINKVIKDNEIDEINISKYELDSTNFKDIIEDAVTVSMFSDKKMIIVSDAYFFTTDKRVGDVSLFEEYFKNTNSDVIIIFKVNNIKLDERKKVTKLIRKIGNVIEYKNGSDINNIVKQMFSGYQISNNTINLLIDRVGNDMYALENEINKIKLYKEDKDIKDEDIINLTSENIDADLFKLLDYIINHDKEKALILYREMVKTNLEPIQIIISLANKYRLMYEVKEMAISGMNNDEIAKELSQNPKYIYMLLKNSQKYTSDSLLKLISALANLDYEIKSSSIDKNLAFELFILTYL